MILKRIFFTILLLCSVLLAPWWVSLVGAIFGTFYFPRYYEVIALGVLADILYGVPEGLFTIYGTRGFFVGVILFVSIERTKKELR